MLYEILDLASRHFVLDTAVDAGTLGQLLPGLIEKHGALIVREYEPDWWDRAD